jgi:flavin-binding protein dodecin
LSVKVLELIGESDTSWKDAVRSAVHEASKTVRNINGVEVLNFTANVTDGDVVEYKANVKIAYADDKSFS